jgi:hypothetical protein
MAIAAPLVMRNWRREGLKLSFTINFLFAMWLKIPCGTFRPLPMADHPACPWPGLIDGKAILAIFAGLVNCLRQK